ncbi:hypothetical protein [Pseudofrankia inefficax]|uniref:Uncharacterized protein n=1 Tax=Pseudofrankia inefficax (strain DSM 45817 / CECT 9037 / DDB 130130 / EuI1c) TaxID=298654 RepID=E3IZ35_PSEI1|nr:hypothetical protein [Pseudofrankia inefficax]ADP80318.1 hypothetical protein FraEuI1c_2279 [Pseudofrankia inefficax]
MSSPDARSLGRRRDHAARGWRSLNGVPAQPGPRSATGNTGTLGMGDDQVVVGHNYGVINIGGGDRIGPRARILDVATITALAESFVEVQTAGQQNVASSVRTTSLSLLAERLRTSSVAVLAGPPGSGRTALAIRGLAETLPEHQLALFDPEVDAAILTEADMAPGVCYVVSAHQTAQRRRLPDVVGELAGLARGKGTHLVLIVNSPSQWVDVLVEHVMPDPVQALRELLVRRHGVTGRDADAAVAKKEVADAVRAVPMVRVAEVAALVAAALRQDRTKPDAFLDPSTRAAVLRKFTDPFGEVPFDGDEPTEANRVFRRAFLVAFAVCNDMTIDAITSAGVRLAEILFEGSDEEKKPGQPFDEPTETLLKFVGAPPPPPDEKALPDPGSGADLAENRVSLSNPALARVTLEVVWREHHLARKGLQRWLDELAIPAEGRRWSDEVQLRAALAVGYLASLDFELMFNAQIDTWIRAGELGRAAAASAVEAMLENPKSAERTWGRIQDWAGRGPAWRTTELLVYATGPGSRRTGTALRAVRREAAISKRAPALVPRVVHAVAASQATVQVFDLLTDWLQQIDDDRTRAQALRQRGQSRIVLSPVVDLAPRCLLLLVDDRRADGGTRAPLLAHVRDDTTRWRRFELLWQLVLRVPGTRARGWRVLRDWLEEADGDAEQARIVGNLLYSLYRSPIGPVVVRYLDVWVGTWSRAAEFPVSISIVHSARYGGER